MAPTNCALLRSRPAGSAVAPLAASPRAEFYRQEILKHWRCLEQQREHYSEKAMTDVETAIQKLVHHVDRLCTQEQGEQLVGRLLRKIDGVTRLSAWSDRPPTH